MKLVETLKLDIGKHLNDRRLEELVEFLGIDLYVVGGAVRDALFMHYHGNKFDPHDVDLATPEKPNKILKLVNTPEAKKLNIRAIEIGKSFGVIQLSISDKKYEVATFREEWYDDDGDGRHPDKVKLTRSPSDDAKRRDLTINSLFYDLAKREVHDYVGGIDDIRKKIIRPVGDPRERYKEDRLRVLRTPRFYSRYHKNDIRKGLGEETVEAIRDFRHLAGVSGERIVAEIQKGINESVSPAHFMQSCGVLGLLPAMYGGMRLDLERMGDANSRNTNVVLAMIMDEHDFRHVGPKLIGLKWDSRTARHVEFLYSLFYFDTDCVYQYVRRRDAFYDPQAPQEMQNKSEQQHYDEVMEFVRLSGLSQDLMDKFMCFEPQTSSKSFPELEGKELGDAIKAETNREFVAYAGKIQPNSSFEKRRN